jgi:outer membrane protein TolC
MNDATTTYKNALAIADAAFAAYDPIRRDYHAGKVSDADYLAARAIYHASQMKFDDAWREAAKANVEI